MKRGEIWTVAGGAGYAGKPRPAVIVQDDRFDASDSIVVCPLTTDPTSAPIFRLPVQLSPQSGLRSPCRLMVDKVTAVPRKRLGTLVGSLTSDEMRALNRASSFFWVCPKPSGKQGSVRLRFGDSSAVVANPRSGSNWRTFGSPLIPLILENFPFRDRPSSTCLQNLARHQAAESRRRWPTD